MYSKMNDNYTYYVDPFHSAELLNALHSSDKKTDTGFEWDIVPSDSTYKFVVTNVISNSPADKAGFKIGDQITTIYGIVPTSELVFEKLSDGNEDENIPYTLVRGGDTLTTTLKVSPYHVPSITMSFQDSIPVIKVLEFASTTSDDSGTYGEFTKYLKMTEQYKSTIIDLRDNGGGDLIQCLTMAQEFLSKGDTIIGLIIAFEDTVRHERVVDTTYIINTDNGMAKDRYFVFLANGLSASCSETLLVGAISNKKFPVVGETTYGKGIGQRNIQTPAFALASITAMKSIDKDKKCYHSLGIVPDFPIVNEDLALKKAVELAKNANYIRTAGYGTENTGHFAKASPVQDTMPGFFLLPEDMEKLFSISTRAYGQAHP